MKEEHGSAGPGGTPPTRGLLRPGTVLAVALAGLLAGALYGRLGGGGDAGPEGAGEAAPTASPAVRGPRAVTLPGAPPEELAEPLRRALTDLFAPDPGDGRGAATREAAFTSLESLVDRWRAGGGAHPLSGVAWWRAALRATAPRSAGAPRGILRERPDAEDENLEFLLSVPERWDPAGPPLPVLLTLLEYDAAPGTTLRLHYGDLLDTHLVAAGLLIHPRRQGVDPFLSDPTRLLKGLDLLSSRWPVDFDRVSLDGMGRGVAAAETLAAVAATRFHGAVHRAPMATSPLAANLSLFAQLLLVPPDAAGPMADAAATLRGAAWETTVVEDDGYATAFLGCAPQVAAWIRALPPRRLADPRLDFTWTGGTDAGAETWGHRFVVDDVPDRGADRTCSVRFRVDRVRNAVLLDVRNVGSLRLLLSDEVVDLDRTVAVQVNGNWLPPRETGRDLETLRRWAERDRGVVVTAEFPVRVPPGSRAK